ncbi:MAG: TIGR01459 family HAD-type hydrolase [Hyphomonadaceae bacterium]|nr:TIGR01459 family HAD-type hydrolase [Hyphomonadaceae bacterium]
MTIALRSLDDISDQYDAILCDVWGVIHNGRRPYLPACAALERARARGLSVLLFSNVPKPRESIPPQLARIGAPRSAWDAIITSGDAIRGELAARAPGPMFKIGPGDFDRPLWEGLGLIETELSAALFIGISGLFNDDDTPEQYADILRQAKARDMELLCANPDIVVQFGDKLIWCAGAVARDYEAMGGRVVMAGKPFAPIYTLAYRELQMLRGKPVEKSRILAIGDGIGTDVKGAAAEGLDCIFVAAGTHGESLWTDGVLDLEKAKRALAAENLSPRYAMAALA